MITVTNLATMQELNFTCGNRQALLSAYALEHKDGNSWDYEKKYGPMVEMAGAFITLGDWTTPIVMAEG